MWGKKGIFDTFVDLKYKMNFTYSTNTRLELAWNILPIICLSLIAGPSFTLLYLIEDYSDISFLVKNIVKYCY
jgi:heme/copper-type cytochrome/quinol oxidase subunit 2